MRWIGFGLICVAAMSGALSGCSAGGYDGPALGTPYACGAHAGADGGAAATCVVGQSYCEVQRAHVYGDPSTYSCWYQGLDVCSNTPTCACICNPQCAALCTCDDSSGVIIMTCNPL